MFIFFALNSIIYLTKVVEALYKYGMLSLLKILHSSTWYLSLNYVVIYLLWKVEKFHIFFKIWSIMKYTKGNIQKWGRKWSGEESEVGKKVKGGRKWRGEESEGGKKVKGARVNRLIV